MSKAGWLAAIVGAAAVIAVGALLGSDSTRAIGLAVPIGLLLVVAMVWEPTYFLLFYVALRPLADAAVHVQIGPMSLGALWGGGLMIALALYWVARGLRQAVRDISWLLPIAFALAYAVFTFGRGGDTAYAFSSWIKIASWVLLAITCEQIAATAAGQRAIVRAGTLMAVLTVAVIALAVVQNQYGAAYYTYGQYDTVGQGPHQLASMAVLLTTFVWIGAMHGVGRMRWLYVALAGLLGVGIALSLVRTTFLAFALLTVWFLIWSLRGKRWGPVVAALAATTAAGAVVYTFQSSVVQRMTDLSNLSLGGSAALSAGSGRLGIWQAVWTSATSTSAALLLGQGASASFAVTAAVLGNDLWSHNDFLEFLITGGVVLLGLYILTIGWMLVSGTRLFRDAARLRPVRDLGQLVAAAVVAYVVMAFFNGMAFFESTLVMAMLVGLVRGVQRTPGCSFIDEQTSVAELPGPEAR